MVGVFFGHDARKMCGHPFHTYQIRESTDAAELVFTRVAWAAFKAEELQNVAQDLIRHPCLPK